MTTHEIPIYVWSKLVELARERAGKKPNQDDDDWYSVGENFDINIFCCMNGEYRYAIHPVTDGNIGNAPLVKGDIPEAWLKGREL